MASLLEKIKAGKRNVAIIKFPGTDQDVGVVVLSNAEIQEALFDTERRFRSHEIEIKASTVEAYSDEETTQVLFRALRDPQDPSRPFAASVDELRAGLTRAEKNALVAAYNDHELDVSPGADMEEQDFYVLFEDLKKKPDLGNGLSTPTLRRLVAFLASRQSN